MLPLLAEQAAAARSLLAELDWSSLEEGSDDRAEAAWQAVHARFHPAAEQAVAAACAQTGSLLVRSGRASLAVEDLTLTGPWWWQSYLLRDRSVTRDLALRARDAGAAGGGRRSGWPWTGPCCGRWPPVGRPGSGAASTR